MVRPIFSLRFFLYLAYAVILTSVLLYVRFPKEKFKTFCEKQIEQILPDTVSNIDSIVYKFPLSASLENIRISKTGDDKPSDVVMNRLAVSLAPKKFWRTLQLDGELYSGQFIAELDLDRSAESFQLRDIQLKGLDAGEVAKGLGIIDREITGRVDFSGEYQGENGKSSGGSGEGTVKVASGSMGLLQPILALSTIEFETIVVNVSHENGSLSLAEGKMVGKEINADFTGELKVVAPFLNSTVLLSGHLDPEGGYLRSHPKEQKVVQRLLQRYKMNALPFKMGGTVKRPLFRFSK